ncbi:MAG: 4Fe-4S binding protein [Alphaproteobacteria bacterium]
MTDLSVNFAGLKLKNPIVADAGPIAMDPKTIGRCIDAGVGAVILRSITPDERYAVKTRPGHWFLDRLGEARTMMHIAGGLWTPEQGINYTKEVRPLAERERVKLIGSIYFNGPWTGISPHPPVTPPVDDYLRDLALRLEEVGVDAIEIAISCPLALTPAKLTIFHKGAIPLVVKTLAGKLEIPFWIKLGYHEDAIWLEETRAIGDMGMGAIHTLPDTRATFVDVDTGRPPVSMPMTYGRWKRGIACYITYLNWANTKLQVLSSGGVWTWRDAVERLMCGATLVGIETAIQYSGYGLFRKIIRGIDDFMVRKQYKKVQDLVGVAAPHIYNINEFLKAYYQCAVPNESVKTSVDSSKCTGCGMCQACIFGAVTMNGKIAKVDLDLCERCGVCASICPTGAITVEKIT